MCGDIDFAFLYFVSVYKIGSQTKPRIDQEVIEQSEAKIYKCIGHLMMTSEARLEIFSRAIGWCCS